MTSLGEQGRRGARNRACSAALIAVDALCLSAVVAAGPEEVAQGSYGVPEAEYARIFGMDLRQS